MQQKLALWITLFLLALGLLVGIPSLARSPALPMAQGGMGNPMMNNDSMGRGDMATIHELFAHHHQVRRTVREVQGGIQAVTESDNPQVAALIKTHVPKMYQRIANGQPFPMIRMAPSLPTLFQNASSYQRQLKITPKGVVVTETSKDPKLVAVIREHAREVSAFVKEGMPAMMDGVR